MMPPHNTKTVHYQKALDRYTMAAASAVGNHLHVRNGLYLAHLKLGRNDAAKQAFGKIIELGMAHDQLAVNFLFKAGSAVFRLDKRMYSSWLFAGPTRWPLAWKLSATPARPRSH
jgi:hypothetical protein